MRVAFGQGISTALLYKLRDLIDEDGGGSLVVVDVAGKVLFRVKLKRPCAPDPMEGEMALHDPAANINPSAGGKAARAFVLNGSSRPILDLDVGEDGSGAAVELSTMDVKIDDVVRARSRLILSW